MANELQASFSHGASCYYLLRDSNGNIFDNVTTTFHNYLTGSYSGYPISAVEQGAASAFYVGSVPVSVPPGTYSAVLKQQLTANPAETDPTVDAGNIEWGGTNLVPLSDLATSGQVAQIGPIRLARGVMIRNFEFYLVSSADHVTPLTSGVVSGQISRDGGLLGPLQSGAFTEVGKGLYSLQALTSGDLLCNTGGLIFTANGISGGSSDPRPYTMVMQRTSGQN